MMMVAKMRWTGILSVFPVQRLLLCEDTEEAHFLLSLASYTQPRSKVNRVQEQWPNCFAAAYCSGGRSSHMPCLGTTAVLVALNTFACLRTVLVAPLVALALPPPPPTLLACLLPNRVVYAELTVTEPEYGVWCHACSRAPASPMVLCHCAVERTQLDCQGPIWEAQNV